MTVAQLSFFATSTPIQSRHKKIRKILELREQLKEEINQLYSSSPSASPLINSPADAAEVFQPLLTGLEKEELWVMCLNTRHRVMSVEQLYVGTLYASNVRVAEVFKSAIQQNAAAIIVAHNHPSGDPTPSQEDISLTRTLVQAGRLLEIELLDHLVIGYDRWVSLKERGLGF